MGEKSMQIKSKRKRLYELIEPGQNGWNYYDSFMLTVILVSLLPLFSKDLFPHCKKWIEL